MKRTIKSFTKIDQLQVVFLLITFTSLTMFNQSCKNGTYTNSQATTIANNWTEDQKQTILTISKSSANANSNPSIHNNSQDIAQKTLDECMEEYPDYSDFNSSRKNWLDIYKKVTKRYYPKE
jgi:hypothetical protein